MKEKDSLKDFYTYLMQTRIAEEGHNPGQLVEKYLQERDAAQSECEEFLKDETEAYGGAK